MWKRLLFFIILIQVYPAWADSVISISAREFSALSRSQRQTGEWDAIYSESGQIWVIVKPYQREKLDEIGIDYEIIEPDLGELYRARFSDRDDLGDYTTYQELTDHLTTLAAEYPDIVHLTTLGQSWQGREIWGVKVSDNPTVEEDEPEALYMGVHHSRELITVEILLYFLDYLTENYDASEEVSDLIQERQLWFIPMLNPDGHTVVEDHHEGTSWGWWRKNTRDNNGDGQFNQTDDGVDLNRNYGYHWGESYGCSHDPSSNVFCGPEAFSEPETQIVRDFCEAHNFSVALSYHSFGNDLLYPWSYNNLHTDQHRLFRTVAEVMVEENGYAYGNGWEVLNYLMTGEACDWLYSELGIIAFTPEVGPDEYLFYPLESEIEPLCQENLQANLILAEIADNPYRVCPPQSIRMQPVDESGNQFTLNWIVEDPADAYSVATYALQQMSEFSLVTEDAEGEIDEWTRDGFYRTSFRSYSGQYSFYSGYGDQVDRALRHNFSLFVAEETELIFWTWYEIEQDYDYAYIEVSTDGVIYEPIAGNITTEQNPYGSNLGHGVTGSSDGWVEARFPLEDFVGQSIRVRFRYLTDEHTSLSGIYIDDIHPVAHYEQVEILDDALMEPSYEIVALEIGSYAYRARGTSEFDRVGQWSLPIQVSVEYLDIEAEQSEKIDCDVRVYPNPFSTKTRIEYVLPSPSPVRIALYNSAGQSIRELLTEKEQPGGYHHLIWDGKNQAGQWVGNGVYFIRMTAGEHELSRKIVRLR
ncbi:MAG: hypothetical protein B6244_13170 [Candidatus Cloacimonetes bacterium 4572_55]|nr:MAG: hypothetical protein B6244_13170 [Candidatus Cloacimonetes bacterium 4572_55]